MQIRSLTGALTRVVVSVLFAGLFYTGWLAVFLGAFKNSTGPAKAVWFGPMLIVFGMFLVGTGSVTLREFVIQTRSESG